MEVMKWSKSFSLAALAACTFFACPLRSVRGDAIAVRDGEMLHRYVTPNTSVTTNAWQSVSSNVYDVVRAATNGIPEQISKVAVSATNYTDSVSSKVAVSSTNYANAVSKAVAVSATNYTDFAISRLSETNSVLSGAPYQKPLPYPTNAIPYSVIVDAPQMEADRITDGTNTIDAAGNVYSNGMFVGKVALTNDMPPAVVVVAPSTNASAGTAADARATGTALYTGFTEWEFSGLPDGYYNLRINYEDGSDELVRGWYIQFSVGTEHGYFAYSSGTEYAESIELGYLSPASKVGESFSATRHLVTPTKTSQLTNDGTNGVPFAVVSQIPPPVDISGKLDGAAAYPAWDADTMYNEGYIVSHNGRIWKAIEESRSSEPDSESPSWEEVMIGDLKQDKLTPTQIDYINAVPGKVSTNALAGQTYDFSKNYDIIKATADIVQLLGGTVTNNPTANQGGN